MRRSLIMAAVLVLAATACGDGGSGGGSLDSDQQALSDAIFNQIMADDTVDNPFGEPEARCFSDGVARDFGIAELADLGLTVENIESGTEPGDVPLSDEQADKMTALMTGCVDFRTLFIDEFTRGGVSEESAGCLADGFDEDFIRALAKAQLTGQGGDPTQDPEQAEKIFSLITECLTFEELSNLGG